MSTSGLRVELVDPPPEGLAIGRGNACFLRGKLDAAAGIERLWISGDRGERAPVQSARVRGSDAREWWATIPIEPIAEARTISLSLEAALRSGTAVEPLGTVRLEPGMPAGERAKRGSGPRVAIAMATHNPPLDLFRRQIESIRTQTLSEWVCVISDDGSADDRTDEMRSVLGDDSRFRLHTGDRLGFYRNFERALGLVVEEAPGAGYVALADQDDRWREAKLATLVEALGPRDLLAYGDMRIVDRDGSVRADSFWTRRANNFTDFATLLIGNSVTGSAALFRRELLADVLPFPPKVGRAFHDHWLASVALALGSIAFVDRPLQDYVQHPGAVLGFAASNADRPAAAGGAPEVARRAGRIAGRARRPEGRRRYFEDYCRIALAARVLAMRCGERMDAGKRSDLDRVLLADRSLAALASLARLSARSLVGGDPAIGVDRSVMAGLLWRRFARA